MNMNNQLSPDMHLLLSDYLESFIKLRSNVSYPGSLMLLKQYEFINDGASADQFFSLYGVGNMVIGEDRPFERGKAYELLLYILRKYNKEQYLKIHKGTPFYFLAWTAYQFSNFEKAMFYMDAAVSEDLRLHGKKDNYTTPSIAFFLLDQLPQAAGFLTLHISISSEINNTLKKFNTDSGLSITKENFVLKFVKSVIYSDKKHRSVLTALYSFILEYGLYQRLIFLRSSDGGSIEPFINHLFKGARILESLLKMKGKGNDLKDVISNISALNINSKYLKGNKSLISAMNTYNDLINKKESIQNCNFAVSYIIRNTTGHSLLWADEFKTEETYLTLYNCLINSIFWSIYHLWIK